MGKISNSQPRISSMALSAVALGGDDDILGDTAMDDADTTEVTSFAGQPDVPRNVTVKGNDANVSGDVVIEGLNGAKEAITETLALNGSTLVAGNKAFASVTKVTLPHYDTADTERVRVGLGSKLGLPVKLSRDTILNAYLGGVREATRPTVAVSSSALESNTVTLSSALTGAAVIVDYYETL